MLFGLILICICFFVGGCIGVQMLPSMAEDFKDLVYSIKHYKEIDWDEEL